VLKWGPCKGQVGHQRASPSPSSACAGEGNILWDCITVLDGDTRTHLRELGGVRAIAISHPHFYSRMAAWADEFDARVYVHANDRRWVMQPSERVTHWAGAGPGAPGRGGPGGSAGAHACKVVKGQVGPCRRSARGPDRAGTPLAPTAT